MNTPDKYPTRAKPGELVNPDLAEQAVPGHGVPSQDPDAAAQFGLNPKEAEREAKSVYVGGGAMAGLAAGAAVGAAVAGPLGVVLGGTVGTIAGALGGEVAGQAAGPASETRLDRLPTEAEIRSVDDGELDKR